jgi:outer membrane protein assembly factor BamA
MHTGNTRKIKLFRLTQIVLIVTVLLASCTVVKEGQKGKPFIADYSIEVKGGKFTKDEKAALKSRLSAQLEDSAKVNVVDKLFFWHIYKKPPAFDTAYTGLSAKNMKASLRHSGYYQPDAYAEADTAKDTKPQQVTVRYIVTPGKATLIDTVSYRLQNSNLQLLNDNNKGKAVLKKGDAVTKGAVLGEISRLVDLYRNNGFYKFTSEELKVQGDTALAALTNISDDPFEQLEQIIAAQQKKDSPKIKLAVILNPPADSSRLKQFYIRNVYIIPDYRPGDSVNSKELEQRYLNNSRYTIAFHHRRFRTSFLLRNMYFKPGDLYNQTNYYKTQNSFARTGTWQSVNIEVQEVKDSTGFIDMVVQLIPAGQYVFESSLEASYSANSNTNSVSTVTAGNLLGTSGNLSFTNRNFKHQGIRWTSALRAGVEFNLNAANRNSNNPINSNEIGLTNTFVIPKFLFPGAQRRTDTNKTISPVLRADSNKKITLLQKLVNKYVYEPQTFININTSLINRINLFNLQSANIGFGYTWRNRKNGEWSFKPINIEFARLYNESETFKRTLADNPFLRYSFNTALVAGILNFSYNTNKTSVKHPGRQHSFKLTHENSLLPNNVFPKYSRRFAKADFEYKHSRNFLKSAFIFRSFLGIGLPSKKDSTLPFFKQYFGGGSNSMRGWPVRGIGRGSQKLAPFDGTTNRFNDRTGDIQFEMNAEYRYNIAPITSWMLLKGALFADFGNVWNMRKSNRTAIDSAVFNIKNMYRDLGINVGTGFRFDVTYFQLRFDLGFRIKRPETAHTANGWKLPALSFNDVLPKLFAKGTEYKYRRWRYENFNFTIGINLPF